MQQVKSSLLDCVSFRWGIFRPASSAQAPLLGFGRPHGFFCTYVFKLLQKGIEASIPWYCTSCGECTLRCPRDVKPSEMIFELRSALVEEGEIPLTIQKALENTYVQKNPWGRPKPKRGAWVEEAGLKIPHVTDTQSKRLLLTCCIQAYDPRCMVIPVNVAKILNKCGVEFGILGAEEVCCGNEIRRMGET